ncbi:twin-arginine translocation pathway signal [Sulfitobacter sp. SK012]|uniref:twin-arginine translocation pathway signal n=1 Tax=Sulfitobacter sp. SK012 TaxID=1389005 RepID=UPI000E0C2899|nr:twin-arginine translocation pathway signal [Sulfitobacter sp. SK012]AXI46186.1 twin-arginine translocation pathway signal [Sulfitobacter sp. SK012]
MRIPAYDRRSMLIGGAAATLAYPLGLITSAAAQTVLSPTQTMRGGSNNYSPGAPLVDNLGSGFEMSGNVRRADDGAPLANVRIQIWAATKRGGEREPSNHGSVLTAADGSFRLEMEQIVPNFGQPHAHLAYDDDAFQTVFLRPVMPSASDTSLRADFILERA